MRTPALMILLLCSLYAHAQNSIGNDLNFKITSTGPTRVWDYYKNVNLAELAICDSNFVAASNYYKAAFAINSNKAFSKDINNALGAAMDSRDYKLAEKYIQQLTSRHIDSEALAYMRSAYKGEALTKLNAMLKKYPNKPAPDNALVQKLKKMYKWDQGIRQYYMDLYHDGGYMVDSVYTTDDINARELRKIILEKGMLSEAVFNTTGMQIIIIHNTGAAYGGRQGHMFDSLLYKAVLSFDYDVRAFAHILESAPPAPTFKYGDFEVKFPFTILGGFYKEVYYSGYYDEPSERSIDKERGKMGLGSLDDERRKLAARNAGLDSNSVMSKYGLISPMGVVDAENEAGLKRWLAKNGKDAPVKLSVFDMKFVPQKPEPFDVGVLGNWAVIGETKAADRLKWFREINKEYYQGKVGYQRWKNKSSFFPWNYHAEIIENPKQDLTTDTGRYDKARFVPGYSWLIEHGWTFHFGRVMDTEELYGEDSTLLYFAARIDTVMPRTISRYVGQPTSYTIKRDTVSYPFDKKYVVILNKRTYTWIKGNNKTEIIISDALNDKGKKVTTANYYMMDTVKYNNYLEKVVTEKKRLDKLYAKQ